MGEKNLVCLSLVLLAASVAHANTHGPNICAKAKDVALCRSMVNGATDPVAATRAAIEKMISETKRAKQESIKLGQSPTLDVCKRNFDAAISELQQSLGFLNTKDKLSLNTRLAAVVPRYVGCDEAIGQGRIVSYAAGLVEADSLLINMAANCLYLAKLT